MLQNLDATSYILKICHHKCMQNHYCIFLLKPCLAFLLQTKAKRVLFSSDHLGHWSTPQLNTLAAATGCPPQDMEMDPEDQEAFQRAQAIRGARKGFRLESICWD